MSSKYDRIMNQKNLGLIPARFASTRFPGKPLCIINGKSMIQRVFEQASKAASLESIYIATDDKRIYDHVRRFTKQVVMTDEDHPNGTSRCQEAVDLITSGDPTTFDNVINIQGDEPYINPEQIDSLSALMLAKGVDIGTLAKKINSTDNLFNPNVVKVIFGADNKAHYFSRQPIPYLRDVDQQNWISQHNYYKHIGIYGYRTSVLKAIVKLLPSPLEQAEKLEQLRWLENGFNIFVKPTEFESVAIDSPEDLKKLMNNS